MSMGKDMQKIFRKYMITIMTAAICTILVINGMYSMHSIKKQQKEMFDTKIDQVIHILENNQEELKSIKENLDIDYLTRARAAAYVIDKNPELLESETEMKNLAKLLDVDEIHVIDENGILTHSSVPKYEGMDFHEGEQTSGFIPILENYNENAYVIQEAQPNTAEAKVMKYVGVARIGKKGIVQVGLEPVRQMEAQARNTYSYIFSRFSTDVEEEFFAINCATNAVLGHSGNLDQTILDKYYTVDRLKNCDDGAFLEMGIDKHSYVVTRQYGDVLIGAAIPDHIMYLEFWQNSLITLVYLFMVEVVFICFLDYLVEKNVIKGIHKILASLSAITSGNLDTEVSVGGNQEFDELSSGINAMVKSVVNIADRISKIIEMSEVPLAAFEYQSDMNYVFVTSGLGGLLQISAGELEILRRDEKAFYSRILQIMAFPVIGEKDVYKIGEGYVRIHLSVEEENYLGVITDVTKDIQEKQRMQYETNHDQLTGLGRYAYFKEQAAGALKAMKEGQVCAAVMLDLDDFKGINDTYGHDVGDEYLQAFAGFLLGLPTEKCLVSRRSGDEFCIFLYGYKSREEILSQLNSFWDMLRNETVVLAEKFSLKVGASGGVAWTEDAAMEMKELISRADEVLYCAKRDRKGHFEIWQEKEENA